MPSPSGNLAARVTHRPQHIPQMFRADPAEATLAFRDAEIVRLKSEIVRLKGAQA